MRIPLFDKTRLRFPSLNSPERTAKFEITAKRKNADDCYIQSAGLNGREWNNFQFPVVEFLKGGKLEIELGPEPNKSWELINATSPFLLMDWSVILE